MVPIIRDTLISWGPRQRAVGCFCDGEEGFKSLFVQYAIWILGGVVGHQSGYTE